MRKKLHGQGKPTIFIRLRRGHAMIIFKSFSRKKREGCFYVEFLRQKMRKKLHGQGKPTIFSRLRRGHAMIIFKSFSRKKREDVFMWSFCAKRCAKNSTDRANQRFLFACVADTR